MTPVKISAVIRYRTCSVTRAGIGIPQAILKRAGWVQGRDRIRVGFIEIANCTLLGGPTRDEDAFLLSYANCKQKSGGKIACLSFIRNRLQAVVRLPQMRIRPIFIDHPVWKIALLPGEVEWNISEYSQAGCSMVPREAIGVYELLEKNRNILRIGEGAIAIRINAHLRDGFPSTEPIRQFRYLVLPEKEDCEIMEKVLIAKYELETGSKPSLNEIRS